MGSGFRSFHIKGAEGILLRTGYALGAAFAHKKKKKERSEEQAQKHGED